MNKNYIFIIKTKIHLLRLYNFNKFCAENSDYCDINLYKFIENESLPLELIQIDYKLILSKCNIIAISGDSGSGKSSLTNHLVQLYGDNVLKLETDRYHKWERGNENYNKITHLNPSANYLELMSEDVYNLKIGNEVFQVDYDHCSGKFTDKCKIESKDNIVLCGLHTLYENRLNNIIDIKIYMDTDRDLIKKWKIKRDVEERNHSIEKILTQIKNRNEDYYLYIHNQKKNADIIIRYYEIENSHLNCDMIVQNKLFFYKLSEYFIKYNYSIKIEDECFTIQLKNDFEIIYNNENIENKYHDLNFKICDDNKYYNEILVLIILYIYNL